MPSVTYDVRGTGGLAQTRHAIFMLMFGFLGFPKKIGIASSPNTFSEDRFLALRLIFSPRKWLVGRSSRILEESFMSYLGVSRAVGFESGRAALYEIVKGLGMGAGDEVIVPAYTCVVVPAAVMWSGAKPVYADIEEETFNIDSSKLDDLVTSKTRAIVVQHTFGQAANLETIVPWARSRGIKVIEDCAHSLGATYKGELLGTFGDAAFFSFGQEKSISCVRGGMAVTGDPHLGRALETAKRRLGYPPRREVLRNLLHPLIWGVVNPTYYFFNLGKLIVFLSRKVGLLRFSISAEEACGKVPAGFPRRLPNALAALANSQFRRIERFNAHRREIALFYLNELSGISKVKLPKIEKGTEPSFLRFGLRVSEPERLLRFAKVQHIILGNWYNAVPYPKGADHAALGYLAGSCPVAESVASQSINLPTSPTMRMSHARRVVRTVKAYYERGIQS